MGALSPGFDQGRHRAFGPSMEPPLRAAATWDRRTAAPRALATPLLALFKSAKYAVILRGSFAY